ncbi:hypothetical protein KAX21_06565 [candidate division WOR-3 bacterium]|nr:hypothetical protein [candidate division WOR-3 bacterium]
MNAEKPLNLWVKIAAIVGGFGSFIAIGFLIWNLIEIRRQQEFEYRGFLVAEIVDIQTSLFSPALHLKYRFRESGRVPPLFKGIYFTTSINREKDIQSDFGKIKPRVETEIEKITWLENKDYAITYEGNATISSINSVITNRYSFEELTKLKPVFYVHCIFKYEDVMGQNYWVYMRWEVERICTKFDVKKRDAEFLCVYETEDYIRWKARRNEKVPSHYPKELRQLSKDARNKKTILTINVEGDTTQYLSLP